MNALVTGGGGFLGLAIVRALLARGDTVRSLSRRDHTSLRQLGVKQVLGDLADSAAVNAAVAGCDTVFHTAALAGIWGPIQDYQRTNVLGTENVIAACRRNGVSRLIYTSSPSVVYDGKDMEGVDESVPYPEDFPAYYPMTKAAAERLVLAAGDEQLACVAIRPHLIWGPGDNHLLPRFAAQAKAGQLRRIGTRGNRIDTTYIDNAAGSHLLAADRLSPGSPVAGKAYFISQGEPIELWEMVNRMLHCAGLPPVTKTVPRRLALMLAWYLEVVHSATRKPGEPRLTRFVVREFTTSRWFNIDAARRDLGYAPTVSTEEGFRRLETHLRGGAREST